MGFFFNPQFFGICPNKYFRKHLLLIPNKQHLMNIIKSANYICSSFLHFSSSLLVTLGTHTN